MSFRTGGGSFPRLLPLFLSSIICRRTARTIRRMEGRWRPCEYFSDALVSSCNVSTRTVETRPEHILGRSSISSLFGSQRLNPVCPRMPGFTSGIVNVSSLAGRPGHTFGRVNFSSTPGSQRLNISGQCRPGHISGRVKVSSVSSFLGSQQLNIS